MSPVILYYSNSGTTRQLAEKIHATFGGELLALTPKIPYGSYFSALKRVGHERRSHTIPEYDAPKLDLSEASALFIGYPLWYSEAPAFVLDCLKHYNLSDKMVIPFSTSGASNIKSSLPTLQTAVGSARILAPYHQGKLFKDDFDAWAASVRQALQ